MKEKRMKNLNEQGTIGSKEEKGVGIKMEKEKKLNQNTVIDKNRVKIYWKRRWKDRKKYGREGERRAQWNI